MLEIVLEGREKIMFIKSNVALFDFYLVFLLAF